MDANALRIEGKPIDSYTDSGVYDASYYYSMSAEDHTQSPSQRDWNRYPTLANDGRKTPSQHHMTDPQARFRLTLPTDEMETDQSLSDDPAYDPVQIPIQKSCQSAEPADMSDMLLLAWVLLMRRYNGDHEIHFSWGYTEGGAGTVSTGLIGVQRDCLVADVLESIRLLRDQSPFSVDYVTETSESYIYFNNASLTSNGRSNWTYRIEVRECESLECDQTLWLKPSWDHRVMGKPLADALLSSFKGILRAVFSNSTQLVAEILGMNEQDVEVLRPDLSRTSSYSSFKSAGSPSRGMSVGIEA
ncbi:hypothetical protein WAI453_006601 [Rhynchosporium graminicola]|uniref:Uncharacterized protein n=1 Tax=Rhynchosporium graminicola TaxID=2792576 RepID=A0A1E1K3M9_9HELO|nr:uncharacterized protein RCO7_11487 [Rhynchosporium commune]